jgi:RNA polymerase sigma factor (sigma-70 family)
MPRDPIHTLTTKLLHALRVVVTSLYPHLEDDADDIVQEAFIKTAEATWDWCPSKAYLKRAVQSAAVDFMRREGKDPECPVDFRRFEVEEDEDPIKDLYYKKTGEPLDVVDFMAKGFRVFGESRPLSQFEREVLGAWNAQGAKGLPPEPTNPFAAFSDADRAILEDQYYNELSLRELAAKYGLSKSTLHRRLKDLAKAIPGKEDVVSKPSRQKTKRVRKKSSGTKNVLVVKPSPIEAISA